VGADETELDATGDLIEIVIGVLGATLGVVEPLRTVLVGVAGVEVAEDISWEIRYV
jgi:hypothetical protein